MDGHIQSYQALIDSEGYLPGNRNSIVARGDIDLNNLSEAQQATYEKNTVERPVFVRERLMRALDNVNAEGESLGEPYDVLLYPTMTGLAGALGGNPSAGSNNRLSPFSMFPALSMPAGMTNGEPAMPVGMEMLGREFAEPTLIKLAYSYQQTVQPRRPPVNTPELVSNIIQ